MKEQHPQEVTAGAAKDFLHVARRPEPLGAERFGSPGPPNGFVVEHASAHAVVYSFPARPARHPTQADWLKRAQARLETDAHMSPPPTPPDQQRRESGAQARLAGSVRPPAPAAPPRAGSSAPPAVESNNAPPEVPPPAGRSMWSGESSDSDMRRLGSHAHGGPREVEVDKGNQDFAFHLEMRSADGTKWALCGVADGAGQGSWSARAARQAAAGFIEAVQVFLDSAEAPRSEADLSEGRWHAPLGQRIHRQIRSRIEEDAALLRRGRYIDPTWTPKAFVKQFFDSPEGEARIRATWFQTTLLAVAIGPYGGFALFLGDGFVRIDRELSDGLWDVSPGLDPSVPVTLDLSESQVRNALTKLMPRGARRLGVLLVTDGVSTSTNQAIDEAIAGCSTLPGHEKARPLERVFFSSSSECARALDRLAHLPAELAARDNMSIAFASCALQGKESRR